MVNLVLEPDAPWSSLVLCECDQMVFSVSSIKTWNAPYRHGCLARLQNKSVEVHRSKGAGTEGLFWETEKLVRISVEDFGCFLMH